MAENISSAFPYLPLPPGPEYIMYFWKENSNQLTFLGSRIGFIWCIILLKSNIILRKILMVTTLADSTRKWTDSRKLMNNN